METIPLNIGLKGQYKIEIKRNNTIIKETDWFDNLITDYGISNAKEGEIERCEVGTGTTTPSILDLKLEQRIAFIDQHPTVSNSIENNKKATVYKFTFPKGSVIGNITEVGVRYYNSASLFSRSLITDSNNIPTALTITDIDELTVYYKILIKFPTEDTQPFTIVNNGVTHTVIGRRILKTKAIPHYFANLTSVLNNNDTTSWVATSSNFILSDNPNGGYLFDKNNNDDYNYIYGYSDEIKLVDYLDINPDLPELTTKIILNHTVCNWSDGIKYVAALNKMFNSFYVDGSNGTWSLYYFEFDPPLVKTNEQELHITYKMTWGRE